MESMVWGSHNPGVWTEEGWLVLVADIFLAVVVAGWLVLVVEPLEVGMVYWA